MRQQDLFVSELKLLLDRSGVNQDKTDCDDCAKMKQSRMKERCVDIAGSTDEDEAETQGNAESRKK